MLGAIVGDIIGYFYEWNNVKTLDFDLFPKDVTFTDDTVMTLAVAKWLIEDKNHTDAGLVKTKQELGRKYPNAGYGRHFYDWIFCKIICNCIIQRFLHFFNIASLEIIGCY